MTIHRSCKFLAVIGILSIIAGQAAADPSPNELLKFYQMPLNNGFTPYLPGVISYPAPSPGPAPFLPPYGTVPSTAIFPGHDELSTATRTNDNTPWQGVYMADDFADYAGTPVTHVRWWGSYLGQQTTEHVKRFLISFEHNVPASTDPLTGAEIPSHPDFDHPGNLHQIVDIVLPGPLPPLPPPPGMFTEKPVPTPVPDGAIPPPEPLFEYNAELHLDKWFHEERATPTNPDDVYWLKIVALNDAHREGLIQWGWHNRDWSIPDALAAKAIDTPDGGEGVIGVVPAPVAGFTQPVWHFEDDAVSGGIVVIPTMPFMPTVQQTNFIPQNYVFEVDGPSEIQQFSKDLAFELYTIVPEPVSAVLLLLGVFGFAGLNRSRR